MHADTEKPNAEKPAMKKAKRKKVSATVINGLWARPVVSERDAARMLDDLPFSTWMLLKKTATPPMPIFGLGKRNYILVSDLVQWLQAQRERWQPRQPRRRVYLSG